MHEHLTLTRTDPEAVPTGAGLPAILTDVPARTPGGGPGLTTGTSAVPAVPGAAVRTV
ncbi:hypothetical protein B0I33_108340 [Prauserella shujinwangii]|uniref:Uncharacterized protein n=1 Tax=Prauserella shujinwangii TaxID=1453103 RepID=A0A2T0LRR1_9PSEU|nr:hypothetical protein [Prauserella shujinwangii]PRX46189.1 hypothetical protein B0I33_108340 [Prauserella shujinwangii]